uniref:Peptidase S1 domain-containing protein n=1 Tax=Anopheles atroparvus TaxID=41427 RepID=A0AAG5DHC7_ANOAO
MSTTVTRWLTVVPLLASVTFYLCVAQFSESSEEDTSSQDSYPYCSNGNGSTLCVPAELCVNGRINSAGISIISKRISDDDECDSFGVVCCEAPKSIWAKPTTTTITTANATTAYEVPDPDWSGQCGERNVIGTSTGNETSRWEFPWSVGLFTTVNIGLVEMELFLCGGILIDDQAVLTAAVCVQQQNRSNLFIHIGRWNINDANEPSIQVIHVESVKVHRRYSASNRVGNIALLYLNQSANTGPTSNRVCLPDGQNFKLDASCYVVGWMRNSAADGSNSLLKLEAEHADRDMCRNRIRQLTRTTTYQLPKEHICADYNDENASCGLAKGSSMVCALHKNSEQFFLVGIASHTVGSCKSNLAMDVFQSTQHYISWIDEIMISLNRYTSYYRPDPSNDF